jgi:predicted  nucleic acid-binding Zn-ribbon protein
MGALLDELRRLQGVELQLAAIRRNRETKTRHIEVTRRHLRQSDEKVQQSHAKVREVQMKIDELSLEVAAQEESIARHRQALNKAKTNKEYAAILAAMNTEKADSSKVENAVLQHMEEISRIKAEGTTIEAEKAKIMEHAAAAEAALATFDEQSAQELRRLQGEREEIAGKIHLQAVEVFKRVAQRHEGEAMAVVSKLRPKRDEWSCGGCNIKVTLEVVNALQTRDEIQTCKVCGRILYLDAPAIAKSTRA